MQVQSALWHTIAHCEPVQVANAKNVWEICPQIFPASAQSRLLHKSNKIDIPPDARLHRHQGRRTQPYSQGWHFDWMTWVRSTLIHLADTGTSQMAIFIYLPDAKELQVYSNLRRMNDGSFARRLIDKPQQLFVIAERLILLKTDGIYGGTDPADRTLPDTVALY